MIVSFSDLTYLNIFTVLINISKKLVVFIILLLYFYWTCLSALQLHEINIHYFAYYWHLLPHRFIYTRPELFGKYFFYNIKMFVGNKTRHDIYGRPDVVKAKIYIVQNWFSFGRRKLLCDEIIFTEQMDNWLCSAVSQKVFCIFLV